MKEGDMIEFRNDGLVFSFPEVHPEARCSIIFQRTLRVPEDSRSYPVPPGLGRFSLERVDDHRDSVPVSWARGGALLPMYQSEALLVIFVGWYPFAIKVTVGGVNAVTGKKLQDERYWRPQDYVVFPRRPWMEWFCVGNGRARQFVAMPLGKEYGGIPGSAERDSGGDIRITAHPMRADSYGEYRARRSALMSDGVGIEGVWNASVPGEGMFQRHGERGREFGHGAWELSAESECSVYPVNSRDFARITGHVPPGKPPTRIEYTEAGLPWHGEYGEDVRALGRSAALS
jgi:hypothetical protein